MNPLKKLELIKKESSTIKKVNIIKDWYNEDNKSCKVILNFLYDKNIKTNLSKKKINKQFELNINKKPFYVFELYDMIDFLSNKCTGKDKEIQFVQEYIESVNHSLNKDFLKEFFCKELSLGLDIKLVNKAIPNLIEVIEPMLATNYNNIFDKLDYEKNYYFTMKLDGNRMILDARERPFKAYSRNSILLKGLDDFLNELNLPLGYIYDGELLPSNTKDKISSEQYKEINSLMKTKGVKDKNKIKYYIFDIVNLDKPYKTRREDYLNFLEENKYQTVVPILHYGKIDKEVFKLLKKVTKDGNEGLMANLENGEYQNVRSKNILKFKKFNDVDLKCVNIEEGTGKLKNKLGNIIVEYKGNLLSVGTGFNDEERKLYWENPLMILNKIVKIKFFEESKDKNGKLSLRFPVFEEIRKDKEDVSYH